MELRQSTHPLYGEIGQLLFVMKHCIACNEEISNDAKVCRYCLSSQNKALFFLNRFTGLTTVVVSVISLSISFFALYRTIIPESREAIVSVQPVKFGPTSFSFLLTNFGNSPTIVRGNSLKIDYTQLQTANEGTDGFLRIEHSLEVYFPRVTHQLSPGQSTLIEQPYEEYLKDHVKWTTTSGELSDFSVGDMYHNAAMGSNLHCEIHSAYTNDEYFPNNISSASGTVNGTCPEAIAWFWEHRFKDEE